MKKYLVRHLSHARSHQDGRVPLGEAEQQGGGHDRYPSSHSLPFADIFHHHKRLQRILLWIALFLLPVLFVLLLLTRQTLALFAEILVVGLFDRCYEALQRGTSSHRSSTRNP